MDELYKNLYYEDDLVNEEKQRRLIEDYKGLIKRQFNINLKEERKILSLQNIFATQCLLEKDKYDKVIEYIRNGKMNIPILVEEFYDEQYIRVIIDGHVRARARYDLGQRKLECLVLYYEGSCYNSFMLKNTREMGFKRINEVPLEYANKILKYGFQKSN